MTRPPGNTDHTGCLSGGHNVVSVTDSNVPSTPLAADDLAELRREFPQFRIWRETLPDRSRYVARSQRAGLNPHTVVTDDLGELRAALGGTARTQ
jgi:hypothetical protein